MNREHHLVPAGLRPAAQSPTRSSKENISPSRKTTAQAAHDVPMLHASSSNNHSLFSFGRNGAPSDVDDNSTTSFDFLPSVSFDDLQSSLESASTEFKLTQFPSPSGQGSILGEASFAGDKMTAQQYRAPQSGGTGHSTMQSNPSSNTTTTRPSRSGSILRRPSTSGRQVSNGSTVSMSSTTMDAPVAPAAMRSRRQSHYPPVSSTNIVKPPRKSIGPGIIDSEYSNRGGVKRRPSLLSGGAERLASEGPRSSTESVGGDSGDNTRQLNVSRATKARSIQPAPRLSSTFSTSTTSNSSLNPEKSRMSSSFSRSPRAKGATTATSRRVSVMPITHGSHASGLGARTISPTDAQRMKRMSAHPQSLASIATAPPPPIDLRPNSRSPSMIPRKASTPSSSRTTPEVTNRKSYSSGLSVGSTTSHNTHRTSTSSIQRLSQGGSSTRLPAPKSLGSHNPPPAEEEEDVPPVPAIPKAYESPKDSPAEIAWLEKRKSNLETSSIHSNSTGTLSNPSLLEPPIKMQGNKTSRKSVPRKSLAGASSDVEKKEVSNPSRKNLQPLSLPPLNLGPLSTPTAAKIAALQEQNYEKGRLTPPPTRILAKTPTTPMTASRSTFFSRGHLDKAADMPIPRSSSSVHHSRLGSPSAEDTASSSESLMGPSIKTPSRKPAVSPFLSSSAPKGGDTFENVITKSKTFGDLNHTVSVERAVEFKSEQRPIGPRAPRLTKPKSPPPQTSPEEPQTPSSMTSLRRKLSLSWKRSNSKSSNHVSVGSMDKTAERQARQESMPPPRIPVSASIHLNNPKAQSPSHSMKPLGGYLESKRRKSSASSLNTTLTQDRTRADSWNITKKDVGNNSMIETSTQPRVSSLQKAIRPRPSVASIKHNEPYVAELDRDDLVADEEIKKLGARKKETEIAARTLDALRKRATPKERVGFRDALEIAILNIYEKGEIVDYNDIYFCGTQNANKIVGDVHTSKPNFGYDDERGDYSIVMGDHLAYRYEIVDVLGKGSFGQVVRCIDHKTGGLVAVKIIRNKKRFHQQALVEVNILKKLREWDPKNKHSHLCISTELLDMNLYEFIKSNSFRGFSLKLIRRFTKQMLSSLAILKQHKVIHCDLKPENILLRHPLHSEIKVIDFGSSCFENEKVYTYIQSRFYRSPEVILGMTYGLPIDMWSLGCILAELYTGEQLACIMEVFGPPEKHLIEKSTRKKLFFDSMGKPRLTVSTKGRRRRPSSKTLQQAIKCDDEPWDPDRRLKPEEAIRHEFITGHKAAVPIARPRESPLPDPPTAGKGNSKPVPATASSAGVKRTSTGNGPVSSSSRTASGKQDLASVGANVAMSRRA
ncbi:hypothetical protein GGR51DRAFT_546584 [Nemania sp. FL0031]|nr:hypothetical protein GGR51DRAFT_546584 [Nemania sp. FL0031]